MESYHIIIVRYTKNAVTHILYNNGSWFSTGFFIIAVLCLYTTTVKWGKDCFYNEEI